MNDLIAALPELLHGLWLTLKLLILAVLGGLVLGMGLALLRQSKRRPLALFAQAYVNCFRSIPLLLVIIWFYLAIPLLLRWLTGQFVPVGAFISCLIAFTLFEAAYYCEIVRAGIEAIARQQRDAAYALGMTYLQAMRYIILPQALRKMLPLLLQQSIILFQDTSLVYAVGLMDFLNSARARGDLLGELPLFLLCAGAVYFVLSYSASYGVKRLQKRLAQ